jgi:hypothetical protein
MPSRFAACFLALAAFFVVPSSAQTVCPGDVGDALLACIRAEFTPSDVRSYPGARNALFGSVDNLGGEVEGVYTGATVSVNPSGSDPHGEAFGKGFNTEHTFPQSQGTSSLPARADLHHLFPTRQTVNSARGSLPFGEIDDSDTDDWYRGLTAQSSAPPLAERDEWSERGEGRFEPRESREGDVARAMFYVAAIYEGTVSSSYFEQQVGELLEWHALDPATEADVARSGRVKAVQGNDNPFVLDPTLAERAFGDGDAGEASAVVASFTGALEGSDRVRLRWETSSETNHGGFGVEQRRDGGSFAEIAIVEGAGTTSQPQQYDVLTEPLAPGSYEFRLRLVSESGSAAFTEPIAVVVPQGAPTATVVEGFAAAANGATVTLTWRTTSELDNAGFYLEQRASGASDFAEVGFLEGAGTTSEPQDYRLDLPGVAPGTYDFRLLSATTGGDRTAQGEASVTVNESQTGDGLGVFISEINEPSQFPGEFVELYNAGTEAVDLDGWTLAQTSSTQLTTLDASSLQNGDLTLAPGSYAVVGRGSAAQFAAIFGQTPATYFSQGDNDLQGAPQINGDETYTLADAGGTTVDQFAPPGGFDDRFDRYQRTGYPSIPGTSADAWVADSTEGTPGAPNAVSPIPTSVDAPLAGNLEISPPYPNPARDHVSLSITAATPEQIGVAVFDALGRQVRREVVRLSAPGAALTIRLDVSDLAPGAYLVRIDGPAQSLTQRVLVVR